MPEIFGKNVSASRQGQSHGPADFSMGEKKIAIKRFLKNLDKTIKKNKKSGG